MVSPTAKWPLSADVRSMTISFAGDRSGAVDELHRVGAAVVLPRHADRDRPVAAAVEQLAVVARRPTRRRALAARPRRRRAAAADLVEHARRRWCRGSSMPSDFDRGRRTHDGVGVLVHLAGEVVVGLLDGVGEHERARHEGDAEHDGDRGEDEAGLLGPDGLEREREHFRLQACACGRRPSRTWGRRARRRSGRRRGTPRGRSTTRPPGRG